MNSTTARRFVIAASGLAVEARIARGNGVRALASGGDPVRLATLIERAIGEGASAIASFGIAGGLTDALASGACVIGDRVVAPGIDAPADRAWVAALAACVPDATIATVTATDGIVAEPAAKSRLRASTGAWTVDNESHVVARIAQAHGIPFAVFRVVSDAVDRTLPPAARTGLDVDGGVDVRAVTSSVLRAPGQLGALVRTAIDASRALRALSRGRRRLGAGLGYPDFGELLLDVR